MKQSLVKTLKKHMHLNEKEILNLIEIPPSSEMGDYSFPCFALSKKLKKNPNEIAQNLKDKIKLPKKFEEVKVSEAYLNFYLNKKALAEKIVKEILSKKDKFGSLDFGKGKKALVEHTSVNPNASPHIGRARNAIVGDSIVRLLNFVNFKTQVHYYVNDVSKQIAMLVLANADKLKFESMLKKYIEISAKVEKSKKLEQEVFELLRKFEKKDKSVMKKFKKITDTCVKGQEKILSEIGIKYHSFDYESNYISKTKSVLEKLKKTKKLFKDDEGRIILNQKGTSVENKMKSPVLVLTRSDGTALYPLGDMAYTLDKLKKAKKNVIVLGEDHKLYFQQLSETLKLLKLTPPEIVHYSFILLKEKNKSKKMSTRKGEVVLLENFIKLAITKAKKEISKRKTKGNPKAVGVGAVKYSILKNNLGKAILFDLDEALNFEGDTGPYIQYSYARASSILSKAKSKKGKSQILELDDSEIKLVKKLFQFPEIIEKAYKDLNPSYIANYSYQLAKTFNEFYHSCPVINSKQEIFRINLVKSFRQVLKNSLNLLGIDVIEKM